MHLCHPGVHRLCLEAEIQLLGEIVREVGDDVLCGQSPAQLGELDQVRAAFQDLQVGGDAATDPGPLDFDDDLFAAVQGRVVHLGDRRRRERFSSKVANRFAGSSPRSSSNSLRTSSIVGGRHRIEQAAELAALSRRTRPAGRDDLTELDIGGSEIDEHFWDLPDDLLLQ